MALSGKCSALIKLAADLSDVFLSHSTWDTYTAALRIFKHYNFSLSRLGPAGARCECCARSACCACCACCARCARCSRHGAPGGPGPAARRLSLYLFQQPRCRLLAPPSAPAPLLRSSHAQSAGCPSAATQQAASLLFTSPLCCSVHPLPCAARRMSFSSYPGELFSDDDFYLLDSRLVVLQVPCAAVPHVPSRARVPLQ